MANISITYTFSNGSTADATEVNQNFTDIINGTSDGTKDLSVSAITAAGTATFNGAVNLGNATSDDITITGRIASDIDPKTAASNTLGDATQTWQALYVDNTSTDGGAIYFDGGTTEFIKASADGADLDLGGFTGFDLAGAKIKTFALEDSAKSDNYTVTDTDEISIILMTTGASDKTVTLPTASDNSGRVITCKKVDSGAGRLLISEEGTDQIDGYSTVVAPLQFDFITVQCDGTTWHIINRRYASEWIAFTPEWTAFTSNPAIGNGTLSGEYRRVGNSVEYVVYIKAGSTTTYGSGAYFITNPASLTTDANQVPSGASLAGNTSDTITSGTCKIVDVGTTFYDGGYASPYSTTKHAFQMGNSTAGQAGDWTPTAPFTFGNTDVFSCRILVPVEEWSDVA